MKEEKTKHEIFEQKYPAKELADSPMLCAEAIGYLKALMFYFPQEKEWVEISLSMLTLIILLNAS